MRVEKVPYILAQSILQPQFNPGQLTKMPSRDVQDMIERPSGRIKLQQTHSRNRPKSVRLLPGQLFEDFLLDIAFPIG